MAAPKPLKLTGHGFVSFWGVTPALDVLSHDSSEFAHSDVEKWLNVLLCSPGDCRHVLKSIAVDRCRKPHRRYVRVRILYPS